MSSQKIPSPSAPIEILAHLFAAMPAAKRTRVKEILRSGLVHVNGESVLRHDHPVSPGDLVEIRTDRNPPKRILPFPVLFEDASLIAINKPNGLLTVETKIEKQETAFAVLKETLARTREKVFVVHRLDRYTSGVLLFAKSEECQTRVMGNWKAAEKIYHAVVEGVPSPRRRNLIHHLYEDDRLVVHASNTPTKNSHRAVMTYEVQHASNLFSLLRVELETGKKNQIRAQLAVIGHPIAGDGKYGANSTDPIRRLCLHASSLSIPHPFTGERLLFEAPYPADFEKIVRG